MTKWQIVAAFCVKLWQSMGREFLIFKAKALGCSFGYFFFSNFEMYKDEILLLKKSSMKDYIA